VTSIQISIFSYAHSSTYVADFYMTTNHLYFTERRVNVLNQYFIVTGFSSRINYIYAPFYAFFSLSTKRKTQEKRCSYCDDVYIGNKFIIQYFNCISKQVSNTIILRKMNMYIVNLFELFQQKNLNRCTRDHKAKIFCKREKITWSIIIYNILEHDHR
jgi:hypothetical protein